ncbi:MAG: tetratricopeptide repeat protein [Hymenobacter sp.]|nr:MAG: tetratricopeptide repeat protein [Hymenobacter sp.]
MATWVYLAAAALLVLVAWQLLRSRQPATGPQPGPAYQPRVVKTRSTPEAYEKAVQNYEELLERRHSAPLFRLLVMTHYTSQAHEAALATSQRFQRTLADEFSTADLVLHAHLYTSTGEPQQAVAMYTQLLDQSISSAAIYNNRGYAYTMLAEYLLAIQDCNQAIALHPRMAYAYNNRGLALFRLGMSAEGRADIEHSLRLDRQNAYAHRNLGIYYFDQGDYLGALPHFERAHQLGSAPPELAGYLRQTRQQLGLSSAADEQ